MFTGIIETMGKIESITQNNSNLTFEVSSPISHLLKPDQSVAHNGVCLTVTEVKQNAHVVTAIQETLIKTNLGTLKSGDLLNMERCLQLQSLVDGHLVQGHVDTTATCSSIEESYGSWRVHFTHEPMHIPGNITVPKGSVTVNGVSLTVVDSGLSQFSVAIIPYTFEHTTFSLLKPGNTVNIEFDIIGKYIARLMGKSQLS